jgi:hypothetical protein
MGGAEAAIVEPCVVQTRYMSGVLPPVFDGQNWIVTIIERRILDGVWCRVVVDRYAISDANLAAARLVVMTTLAEHVCLPMVAMH